EKLVRDATLPDVLGLVEIGDAVLDVPTQHLLELAVFLRERAADQGAIVRIQDRPVRRPKLDADGLPIGEDPVTHDLVDALELRSRKGLVERAAMKGRSKHG